MHVVHVLEATLGGTRTYLDQVIKASRTSRRRSSLVYADARADVAFKRTLESALDAGWDCYRIDMRREVGAHDLSAALALRKILLRLGADCVHAHSSKAGALVRLVLASMADRPRILYSPHAVASGKAYLAIERLLARAVPATFVAVSDSERDQLARLGLAQKEAIRIAYPAIDSQYFMPRVQAQARERLALPLRAPVVLGIGRLVEQKNPIDFLRVVARARKQIPTLQAIWIGDGHLGASFDAERRRLGLGDVVQHKPWTDDVRDDIAACDVLLSTARFESFGFVVAEAMSMERLAIASRVVGTSDVLQPDWGDHTFASGDVEQAARLLCDVIASRPNAERAHEIRLSIERRFSSARLAAALDSLYSTPRIDAIVSSPERARVGSAP